MDIYLQQFDLNPIATTRSSLTPQEAIAVWLLRFRGEKQHVIAARFGTNAGRIADILTGKTHPDAKGKAFALISG